MIGITKWLFFQETFHTPWPDKRQINLSQADHVEIEVKVVWQGLAVKTGEGGRFLTREDGLLRGFRAPGLREPAAHLASGRAAETHRNFPSFLIRVNGRGPCRPHVLAPAGLRSPAPGADGA